MIVRLQQIDPADAEALTYWDVRDSRGPIEFSWPADWYAYQITALDRDEHQQPVPDAIRRRRLRQLLPTIINGMAGSACQSVLRFDGPMVDGELHAALRNLGDPSVVERYCLSPIQQFDPLAAPPIVSVRVLPSAKHMSLMCNDPLIGVEKSVRLRAFCLPEQFVNPLLDTSDLDDERWRELLPHARYALSTAKGLLSLVLWTPKFEPEQVKRMALGTAG